MAKRNRRAPLPSAQDAENRRKNRCDAHNNAAPPTAQDAENRRRNRSGNPAPAPSAQDAENRRRNRVGNPAAPGTQPDRGGECCGKKLYQVTSGRVVAGKKKGETVELCDSAATRALVQAGHLLPVERTAVKKAEPEKEANDG